jgi:site-specific DNA-methyltransferase (adenine-specific)
VLAPQPKPEEPVARGYAYLPAGSSVSGDMLLEADTLLRAAAEDVVRVLPDGCLDLVYLDPPFGTGQRRKALKGRNGRFGLDPETGFEDPGSGLPSWLTGVLGQCRRLLRPGGALFLHLDYRTVHRARCLLDELFGADNFRNEIIWHYATGGIAREWFARKHDTILYYRNGPGHTFHQLKEKKYLAHRMCRAGVEEHHDDGGWYRFRTLDDVWEIPWLTADARERTGYPSQKPSALVERILVAATDPGDRVADFCCGSGTTAVAAQKLGRRWLACDSSEAAVRIARQRLDQAARPEGEPDGPRGETAGPQD